MEPPQLHSSHRWCHHAFNDSTRKGIRSATISSPTITINSDYPSHLDINSDCPLLSINSNYPSLLHCHHSLSDPVKKLNFSKGKAASVLDILIKHSDLMEARERMKVRRIKGINLKEQLIKGKRVTTGRCFKAGTCCLGQTIFDVVRENKAKQEMMMQQKMDKPKAASNKKNSGSSRGVSARKVTFWAQCSSNQNIVGTTKTKEWQSIANTARGFTYKVDWMGREGRVGSSRGLHWWGRWSSRWN